ncbi:MAG: YbgC/FadM family acyl-CoA thioesterase [Candidatus Omnitrophota bacterium]
MSNDKTYGMKKKVYYHDTDSEGVVYYANYLKYFEEARTEQLLSKGIDLRALGKEGLVFAVTELDISYKRPAKYGDTLTVISEIEKAKNASIYYRHQIRIGEAILIESSARLVCLRKDFKPTAIPRRILNLLTDEPVKYAEDGPDQGDHKI